MVGTQVASMYATIGADVNNFTRGMGTVDNMLHASSTKLGGFVSMLGTGLVVAGTAAAAGLAVAGAGIVNVTNKAATAQQAVADIAANMQLSADETQKVAKLVNDLGIDPKLKVTALEAAAAIDMLGKNGQDLTQIFGGSARATVLLANSTKADFSTAADIATDVMALFNITAKDMMQAVNGITGTTQYSKFGINDYRLALAQAGGVASSVGVNFDDFNATIAAISPLFAGGSDAGTSFKVFLQQLTPSTKPAIKAMKELGLLTESGSNQFYDAAGNMKSMAEVSGLLRHAFAGLSDEQANQYASTIFGTDAMRTAFALARSGADTINNLKQQIGNVDAEKAAATRMNTLAGDYEIFMGVVDALSIRIGDKFLPVAREMFQWATNMVSGNADKIVGFFSGLIDYIPKVADALTWANQGWTNLVAFLQPAIEGVGRFVDNMKLLWLGLSEGDVGIFASGIRGLMFEFQRGLTWVMDYVKSVDWPSVLKSWSETFMIWGGAVWDNVFPYLRALWNSLTSWVTDSNKRQQLLGALGNAWNWLATWAGDLWTGTLSPRLGALWTSLTSWITDPSKRQQMFAALASVWDGFEDWAANAWATVSPSLAAMYTNIITWIDKQKPGLGTALDGWRQSFVKFATDVKQAWTDNFPEISRITSENTKSITGDIGSLLWAVKQLFGSVSEGGPQAVSDWAKLFVAFYDITSRVAAGVVKTVSSIVQSLALLKQSINAIGSGDFAQFDNILSQLNGLMSGMQGTIIEDVAKWMDPLYWIGLRPDSLPGRASGGMTVAGGRTLVGERGPEVVDLPGGSYVHNSTDSMNMMGGGNRRIDIYVHGESALPTDRAKLRELAIALQQEFTMNGARVVLP